MRATLMYGAGDVRVETVPDPEIKLPTDAVVRVVLSCICGSDLWPYASMPAGGEPARMGHEFLGVVEDVGREVEGLRRGDVVVAPFAGCCGTCDFCREGLTTSCRTVVWWGGDNDAGQGEAVRIPLASSTLLKVPVSEDSDLLPSLLTLSDVFCTGHHAALTAGAAPGKTVAVVGDGAVGLCGVLAAKRLGAERIILLGRHADRTAIGTEFGATDVVTERGEGAVARVLELTGGDGAHAVLECVGTSDALDTCLAIARAGGRVSRVGVPQYGDAPMDGGTFVRNITLTGGVAPARAYMDELLVPVLDGTLNPGRVFDRAVALEDIADGYRSMAEREALKVLVRP